MLNVLLAFSLYIKNPYYGSGFYESIQLSFAFRSSSVSIYNPFSKARFLKEPLTNIYLYIWLLPTFMVRILSNFFGSPSSRFMPVLCTPSVYIKVAINQDPEY